MIEMDCVSRVFGPTVAVRDLSLRVVQGEIFAFLGPNGAGKTTTIKMMVGLLSPSSGNICLGGFDVVRQSRQAKARMGYVPDQPQLYDKLSGREFLQFVADVHGLSPGDLQESLGRLMRVFDLGRFLDQLTESYSHGMKQRLAFAAAFLHRPSIAIVDEPMVGLDPRSVRLVKDFLRDQAAAGTTIFMSTHTLSVAEEMADRIGVIHQGRLLFLGTLNELRQRMSQNDSSLEQLFLQLTDGDEAAPTPGESPAGKSRETP